MNLSDLRDGLVSALGGISGLRVYGTVPDSPQVPCAVVVPDSVQYGQTLDGSANVRMIVHLMTASINASAGQKELDGYLADAGSTSIYQTIETNPTLGGKCQNARVTEVRSIGIAGDTNRYYAAELVVDIWAT